MNMTTIATTAPYRQGYADATVDQLDDDLAGNPDVVSDYLAGWQAHQFRHPEYCSRCAPIEDPIGPVNTQHYFGGCPECGGTDGYVNVGRAHWFFCDAHQTRWCAGVNIFSDWQVEEMTVWRANWEKLDAYREVEPLPMVGDDEE